jgi:hypothetical protein
MERRRAHIVNYSGGIGSYVAAKRVKERHGETDLILLFTDTMTEHPDLYRFLVESAARLFCGGTNRHDARRLVDLARQIPELSRETEILRKQLIHKLRKAATRVIPGLEWLCEGRTVWELFKDERFIGNTKADICSRVLKREMADGYVKAFHTPETCVRYLGIDIFEEHRYLRAKELFRPWVLEAPLCDKPYYSKEDMKRIVEEDEMQIPQLYIDGFDHNNCGGFCSKAGQGHFKNLLLKRPAYFGYNEDEENDTRAIVGDYSVLRDRTGGVTKPLTLTALRKKVEEKKPIEENDWRGCACFFDTSDSPDAADHELEAVTSP